MDLSATGGMEYTKRFIEDVPADVLVPQRCNFVIAVDVGILSEQPFRFNRQFSRRHVHRTVTLSVNVLFR